MPASRLLRTKEGEKILSITWGDIPSIVPNLMIGFIGACHRDSDRRFGPVLHGIDGIHQEVDQHLSISAASASSEISGRA